MKTFVNDVTDKSLISKIYKQLIQLNKNNPIEKRAAAAAAVSLQLCPTLCNPIDGSPPGSPVPGILQARTLEWVAISFSMKNGQKTVIDISLKKTYRWPIGT